MLKRKTPLKKVSDKKKKNQEKLLEEKRKERAKDLEFYDNLWKEVPHKCQISGVNLEEEMQVIFFHHLLPKEIYPEFRHENWNILICSSQVHHQIETNPSKLPDKQRILYYKKLTEVEYIASK